MQMKLPDRQFIPLDGNPIPDQDMHCASRDLLNFVRLINAQRIVQQLRR